MPAQRLESRFRTPAVPWIGAFVVGVTAVQAWWMGRAIWGLNVGLLASYLVWAARPPLSSTVRGRVRPLFHAGIAVQLLHFAEESGFGFRTAFPALLGLAPWSPARFGAFNGLWIAVLVLAAVALRQGVHLAELFVWFFALVVGLANGLLHVGVALARGGYFPGLVTAPLLVAAGALLVSRLLDDAAPPDAPGGSGAP